MTAPSVIVAPHIDVPVASTLIVWAVLLGVALAALLGLAALARREETGSPRTRRERWSRRRWPSPVDCARWAADAGELARDAAATADRADEAAGAAAQAQARRARAGQAREVAEHEFDAAQRAYDEALVSWRAGEADRAARVRSEAEDQQQREVSRAALGAYRRGDLSVDDLREVFRRTSGWDPVQEQRERDCTRLRAEAQRRQRAYDAAVAAERIAEKTASVADVAARALAEEAAEMAREARSARAMAEECLRAQPRRLWPHR